MHVKFATLLAFALLAAASPGPAPALAERASFARMFCHFMIGIESDRTSSADYDADMQRAKSYGIDAFALNIVCPALLLWRFVFLFLVCAPVDEWAFAQSIHTLTNSSAANNGMQVFISYDFNWWNTGQGAQIGAHMAQYASLPAQLHINGAAFVSSFAGDGVDVAAMRAAAGIDIMFVPNFHPGVGDFSLIDGALNWMAWPNNGNNKAPDGSGNVTVAQGDASYQQALAGKPYLAPASAWFSTHYGPEVSYSKNWVFPSDLLWFTRWTQLLELAPPFIEIVTWNDYGESHYVGPLGSKHQDDGASKWANDMPHDTWLDMAKPFIAAYHAGATSVNSFITQDQIIYWYECTVRHFLLLTVTPPTRQPTPPANNASGNYFEGRPDGWQSMSDSVFVVTLLKSPGDLTVNSGGNTQTFKNVPAGASSFEVPMAVGQQSFALARNGVNVLAAVSLKDISSVCPCGIYNFNAYTGSIPASFVDQMGPDGLNSLVAGLHVSTCSPTPSLPTSAPPYTGPGGTGTAPPTSSTVTSPPTSSTSSTVTGPTSTPTSSTITTPPVSSTTSVSGSCTITASSQIFPTNCLQPGCVWAGPAGDDPPDHCDG
ncbi:Carbohydrate-binding module family 24 protein [Mycena sanguinolenta]|uniref:Carbohydrate-binding module family 24 protein n=1 Tax=Mycena sanguinolenta TaxID=230812 RepID=A0A8H7D961_9AGAR|nr:Carbohydrate-binding module family 24 protein [Mycena sanguinolenta]